MASIQQHFNCPLWVFVLMCIAILIVTIVCLWQIVSLHIAYRQHKRDLKNKPKDPDRKRIEELMTLYGGGGGGYSKREEEEEEDRREDTSSWDNNNINLMNI